MVRARLGVLAAFETLLQAVDTEIELVNRVGAQAFETRAYDVARAALDRVARMGDLHRGLATLRDAWEELAAAPLGDPHCSGISDLHRPRLPRGRRTPQTAFRLPILQVLVELGGRARSRQVLERLQHRMRPQLKEVDYQPLRSNVGLPRWRNTAYWARTLLTKEGLLNTQAGYGVWEITEAGREYLRRHTDDSTPPATRVHAPMGNAAGAE